MSAIDWHAIDQQIAADAATPLPATIAPDTACEGAA